LRLKLTGDTPWAGSFPAHGAIAVMPGETVDVPPSVAKGLINSGRFAHVDLIPSDEGAHSPQAGSASGGQQPAGGGCEPVGEKCQTIQRQLDALDIAQVDFEDGIDDEISDILVAMVAAISVDDFQLGEPKRSQIAGEGALGLPVASVAERQLRKILAPTRVSRPVKADYY
jgi:hypothetical protein